MPNRYMNQDDGLLDLIKVGTAMASPGLTLFGFPIENWAYVMSITVGAVYLIERAPSVWNILTKVYRKVFK